MGTEGTIVSSFGDFVYLSLKQAWDFKLGHYPKVRHVTASPAPCWAVELVPEGPSVPGK